MVKLQTNEVKIKTVNREYGVNIKDDNTTIKTNEDIIKLIKSDEIEHDDYKEKIN
jgi:hypothetical protein